MSTETHLVFDDFEDFVEVAHMARRPIAELIEEIQNVYLMDNRPWVVGYSGGKDSTVVLQLVYFALSNLPLEQRTKPIFVISSDTLVETPLVVDLITGALEAVNQSAQDNDLPLTCHLVCPKTAETYWVNLLGKGYPAPTKQFRWCTERIKIDPVSDFILEKVSDFGEVVVVLGSRSQESATRAQVLKKHRIDGSVLSRHTTLPNAYIYSPIADWTHDDVWDLLLSSPRPWGGTNQRLFELYKGSNAGECPLVIDTNTPSCGNSRFGCWVCTVVTKDRAMEGLINTGEAWLQPLQNFRNLLAETTQPEKKKKYRNYKRRTGQVTFLRGPVDKEGNSELKHIPGPYWMRYRREFLKTLLKIQRDFQASGKDITLITEPELHKIRKEWIHDPNEPDWEDTLPTLYEEVFGRTLDWIENDIGSFSKADINLLHKLEQEHSVPAEAIMKLIELETSMNGLTHRRGLIGRLTELLSRDWGSLDEYESKRVVVEEHLGYDEQLAELDREYESVKQQQAEFTAA
jgi:DNA sulfur modification protein DndC